LGTGQFGRIEHFHDLEKVNRNGETVHVGERLHAPVAARECALDKPNVAQLLERPTDGPLGQLGHGGQASDARIHAGAVAVGVGRHS
jgi:hypothetical protein